MYCHKCGAQLPDSSKFCSHCGTRMICTEHDDTKAINEINPQTTKKGTLVYLHNILSLEFSLNKLHRKLHLANDPIILHDYWYYSKCYNLNPPIEDIYKFILMYSFRFNKYYFDFGSKYENFQFFDDKGEPVKHRFGKTACAKILDKDTRDKLCTLPIFKKTLFSGSVITNSNNLYFGNREYYANPITSFAQFKEIIEDFESFVARTNSKYQQNLPHQLTKIQEIEKEIATAKELLGKLYSLNIIPSKYRNIGCMFFIYDFFSSSNTPLNDIYFHLDLDKIQSQLQQIIKNQQDTILQQAIIISQNEELLAQNESMFNELCSMNTAINSNLNQMNSNLSSINESCIETSQWSKIAALNAETCAWIGLANFIKD